MNEVLLKDVMLYIQIWTGAIIFFLFGMLYYFWRFKKQHPEVFQPDTTVEDKRWRQQKAELQRQYNNKVMLSLAVVFIWIIGMMLICNNFASTGRGWFLLVYALCAALWVMSLMRKK